MNPDGHPDKSAAFGDIDRDFVLDWLNPTTIARNVINISTTQHKAHITPATWYYAPAIVLLATGR